MSYSTVKKNFNVKFHKILFITFSLHYFKFFGNLSQAFRKKSINFFMALKQDKKTIRFKKIKTQVKKKKFL